MKNKWSPEYEKKIKDELKQSVENTFPSEYLKNKIDLEISNIEKPKGEFKMKKRKLAIIAVAAALLSVGVFAVGRITGSIASSTSHYNYTTYEDVEKAEEKVGFDAIIPEELKGGYEFDGIYMVDVADLDDEHNEFNKRKTIDVTYKNENNDKISLTADKVPETSFKIEEEEHQEIRTIDDTKYYYTQLESLFLANEDEMTPEEKERNENDPFFNVGIGGEGTERETSISNHLSFEYDGIVYMLMADENMDKELLFEIGQEILEQK